MIERMGLTHLATKAYTEISGGERQQAMIARALVQEPKLILFDEPTANLDYGNQHRVVHLIQELAAEGYAIIFTTHVPDHTIIVDDQVGILDKSTGLLEVGQARDLITSQKLSNLYGLDIDLVMTDVVNRPICVAKIDRPGANVYHV